jgi:hypothetical protein
MKLDGREFSGIDQKIPAAQNDYVIGRLRAAGVHDLLVEAGTTQPNEEQLGAIRRKFITQILLSGYKSSILAGCLTETGKKWSRAEADRNAARFDEITDPDEMTTMTNMIAGVVISFFQSVGRSSASSQKSSSLSDEAPGTENVDLATSESLP